MTRVLAAGLLSAGLALLALPEAPGKAAALLPTHLTGVNTPKDEDDPHVAPRNLRLYYTSNAKGPYQIYMTQRASTAAPWPTGQPLQNLDAETDHRAPCLSADDHDLYFATKIVVLDGEKMKKDVLGFDIVHSIKLTRPTEFTAPTPVQSVCTEADELFPWVSADGQELYFNRKDKEGWRLWMASRPRGKGAFGEPKLVAEIPPGFQHPSVTADRRTLYLQGPLEKNRLGLFRSTRASVNAPWGQPEPLDDLNSPEAPTGDRSPCVTRDGTKLYFASDRPGGKGGLDLWVVNDPWRIR